MGGSWGEGGLALEVFVEGGDVFYGLGDCTGADVGLGTHDIPDGIGEGVVDECALRRDVGIVHGEGGLRARRERLLFLGGLGGIEGRN